MNVFPILIGFAWRAANARPDRQVRRVATLLLGLVLGVSIPHSAFSQVQNQQLTPNFRDTDIRQVIEAVGAVTGRNFIIDPRVRAEVTLLSYSPMTPEAFYQAFLSALQIHGFAAIEAGDVVNIIPDATARQSPGAEPGGEGAEYVTRAIQLENVGAAQLVPILRPLIAQVGHLAAHPGSNILIIADRAANVDRTIRIVRRIDQAGTEDIEVIQLENASATEVVRMLAALTQTAQAAGGAPTIQAVADDRTNSILLSGSNNGRLRFLALIAHLDTPAADGGNTEVRYLHYADSEDLAGKLQAQFGAAGAATADGAAGANAGSISVWSDEGTNALVINAPAAIQQDMMAVVDKIDIPRAQVQVDAIIVEVSEELAAEFGVTWAINGSGSDDAVGLTNFGIGTGIVQLGSAAGGGAADPAAIGQGAILGVGSISDTGTSWAAIVSALNGDAATNIISTPTIVTLDNEEAEIRVGQEVPFLSGSFTNTGAAAGSVNPFQTVQREPVGTSLKITPQINEGSGVKLTIEQETSSIAAGVAGAADIVTNTRTITTSVFVEDGNMLILGGLIDDQLLQSEQRVPGLGRIPGLGWLFRARKTDRVKTNLMVFIRPTILRGNIDSQFATNSKYNYIRSLQQDLAQQPVQLMRNETQPVLPELLAPAETAESGEGGQINGNQP